MSLENTDRSKVIKKIIDGKTYNTATSILVHHKEADKVIPLLTGDKYYQGDVELYKTRLGAYYFLYRDVLCQSPEVNEGEEWYEDRIYPKTDTEAMDWMEKHCNEKLESYFGSFAEAGSDEVRITLRLPRILRDRLNSIAKSDAFNLSLNAYITKKLHEAVLEHEVQNND